MPIMRATVTIDSATNLPEDAATNTFHFSSLTATTGPIENILDLLEDLYAVGAEPIEGLIGLMSNEATPGTGRIEVYNLEDAEPRQSVGSREIDATPVSSPMLPAEVSLCVSFQGAKVSGLPQARRRGRIYLPFMTEANNSVGRPASGLITAVGEVFGLFAAAAAASISNEWVVYSRVNDDAVSLDNGWIDNAWDTQRRRGWQATTRTTFP